MYDLIIKGGQVVDGTGAQAFTADVAMSGGKIAAMGKRLGAARREIDADGLLVTPGFVDMHTHYDGQVTWDPYLTPSSWHGCTTVIMGNCGVGFAPAKPDKHDWLIGLMEGVEDIPGSALVEGIKWEWESFPEYLDALERKSHVIDFGTQITHGSLRPYVMGERGADNEAASDEDIAQMAALVTEAIKAGALGFSTSRTMLHKSIYGEPVPGTFASPAEIFGIGRALGRLGTGVFQLASEHLTMATEFEWMKALSDEIDRPVIFNLSQCDQQPELWKDLVALLDQAEAENSKVYAQVAGRAIGILMTWRATAHPFVGYPSYAAFLADKPWDEQLIHLRDPDFKAKLLSETPVDLGEFGNFVTKSWDKMWALGDPVDYEPKASDSIGAIARRTNQPPEEIAYDALMANDGKAMLYFPLFNYSDGNLDVLHELHQHPRTRMGLSDGGAHCGAICDGGMPTFMLTHWTRDRVRGPRLSLEHIIQRQTRDTARTFGIYDRGVLAEGMKADVNVINYEDLKFGLPQLEFDLPAGGRRLTQRATGYVATICTGEIIAENGEFTGALPGKLIRGEQHP